MKSPSTVLVGHYPHRQEEGYFFRFESLIVDDLDLPSAARALKRAEVRHRLAEEQEEAEWVHIPAMDFHALQETMKGLKKEVQILNSRIKQLEIQGTAAVQTEILEIRNVSPADAKEEVRQYVKSNPGSLTSQIVENLRIDPRIVAAVLDELEQAGELEGRNVSKV
jgi:hypothetical protein